MQRLSLALFLAFSTSTVYAQNTLNFSIYPYHTVVELQQLDSGEVLTRTSAGPDVSFQVAPGTYSYIASASGHCPFEGKLSVPDVSDQPVHLNPNLIGCSPAETFGQPTVIIAFLIAFGLLAFYRPDKALTKKFLNSAKRTVAPVLLYRLLSFNFIALFIGSVATYNLYTRRATEMPNIRLWLGILVAVTFFSLFQIFKLGVEILLNRSLSNFWQQVASELENQNGAVWSYFQPSYDFRIILATSVKTECSYLMSVCKAQGTLEITKNRDFFWRPKKLQRRLERLATLLEENRYLTLASVENLKANYVFLPNVAAEKFMGVKTSSHAFGQGESLYVCGDVSEFVNQISSHERREQEQIERSEFGISSEAKATSDLHARLPKGWQVETGVVLPYPPGGDIDARLIIPERSSVVIEIKSYRQSLKVGAQGLEKFNGDSVEKDAAQTLRNAAHYRARGLLWLPNASFKSFRYRGITIFAGDATSLYRHLGGLPE